MKKLFISADIEGTCGIAAWEETEKWQPAYAAFAERMNLEVRAACEGALDAGMDLVVVRDAHDSARNLDGLRLPARAQLVRGWAGDPLCMMSGLDSSFAAAVLTGCHDAAGTNSNPLAHTMSLGITWLKLNGAIASEALINALTASFCHVPVVALSGDAGVCDSMRAQIPGLQAVAVNQGAGNSVRSIHPEEAIRQIREAVRRGCEGRAEGNAARLPDHFDLEIRYREHARAFRGSFYPGMELADSHTLRFRTDNWYEALRMMQFCL